MTFAGSTRQTYAAFLSFALVGLGACDLKTDYSDTEVKDLTTLQQVGFCRDAAYELTRNYIGSFRGICALGALNPDTCVESFDACAEDFEPDLVQHSSKGAVLGKDACRDLFAEEAFADCNLNAAEYVACFAETSLHLSRIDGAFVCTEREEGEAERLLQEATPSCANFETLCPNNPFTIEDIAEAVAASNDNDDPAGDAGPQAETDAGPEENPAESGDGSET